MFHFNLRRKINLSNEIGLSAQYVTQWEATSFLFIDPPWIKAHFLNMPLHGGFHSRTQAFNCTSSANPPLYPFDSRIRYDYGFVLDNLCRGPAISLSNSVDKFTWSGQDPDLRFLQFPQVLWSQEGWDTILWKTTLVIYPGSCPLTNVFLPATFKDCPRKLSKKHFKKTFSYCHWVIPRAGNILYCLQATVAGKFQNSPKLCVFYQPAIG